MSLGHAILATLLSGPASGYELSKRFAVSTGSFWPAHRQQIYAELKVLERNGLVTSTLVAQQGRPDRRDCELTTAGLTELARFASTAPQITSVKDELLVKLAAAELVDADTMITTVETWRRQRAERLAILEELEGRFLKGRSHEQYLDERRRIGPYLALVRGLEFERSNLTWADLVIDTLRRRASRGSPLSPTQTATNTPGSA